MEKIGNSIVYWNNEKAAKTTAAIVPPIKTQTTKPDTFDKKDKKEEKLIFNCLGANQLAKAGAIIGGAVVAGVAIVKRKKIGEFFTNLINSNKKPNVDIPKPPKNATPPKSAKPKVSNVEPPKPIAPKLPMTVENLKKEVLSAKEEDISKLVERVKRGTAEEKKNLAIIYNELNTKYYAMADDLPEKISLGKNLSVVEKQMKEQNLSFIPKLEIKPDDSEKVISDKINTITSTMGFNKNEATLLEGLDWLEKYGHYENNIEHSKYFTMSNTLLDEIAIPLRKDDNDSAVTDKVLSKYIDVYNKFAKKWESDGYIYGDSSLLSAIFKEQAEKMSKETAFRFLESMEKTAVLKNQANIFKLYAEDLKIDEKSKEEFIKRAEALCDKLPKYRKISANK